MRATDLGGKKEREAIARNEVRGLAEGTVLTKEEREGTREEEEAAMDWRFGVDKVESGSEKKMRGWRRWSRRGDWSI